ncbi:MAG: histidine kinase [Chitinophagaceae bacterium]|nr:histidine kinase [Chitinophagaceae bacterium]
MLLLLLAPLQNKAQQQGYVFQTLTIKDGLASDIVNSITQDSKGYYWLGTHKGLQRFDGNYFSEVYTYGSSHNLQSPADISIIEEDAKGNIWGLSQRFICIYNPSTGKFNFIKIFDDSVNPYISQVESFCKDENGTMWISTKQNVYYYDYKANKEIFWLNVFKQTDKLRFTRLLYDSTKKSLWIIGDEQLFSAVIKTKTVSTPFKNQSADTNRLLPTQLINVFMDSRQNIWVSNWDGYLNKYNLHTFQKEQYILNQSHKSKSQRLFVAAFEETKEGTLWVSTGNAGLFYYDEKKNSFDPVPINKTPQKSIENSMYISCLFRDKEGNLFENTEFGVKVLPASFTQFITLDYHNSVTPFPAASATRIFESSTGAIYVGTWGKGWLLYNKDFKLQHHFYQNEEDNSKPENIRNLVWDFTEDTKGKIWIGYQKGLVGIFDTVTHQITYRNVPEFHQKTIRTLLSDRNGDVWFGLHSGLLAKWDYKNLKFSSYPNSIDRFGDKASGIVQISSDNKSGLWVATDATGFYRFDRLTHSISDWNMIKNADSSYDYVSSISMVNDSAIRLTTGTNGVLHYNTYTKAFFTPDTLNQNPVKGIYGVSEDEAGNTWFATNEGLFRKNKNTGKLVSFNEEDGLMAKIFISPIVTLSNGYWAIAASSGVVYFNPSNIQFASPPSTVRITGFKVFNQNMLVDSLLLAQTISLSHLQNFITINFASLGFSGRNSTHYFYRLSTVDKDWVDAGSEHIASYTNLTPGNYTFEVKSENREGISSVATTLLSFTILPPWWATWWAWLLYALLLFAILSAIYRNSINRIEQRQSEQIKAMVATQEEERKRISRDIHDEVGTKLSALKLFLSSLKEKAAATNNTELQSLATSSTQIISEAMHEVRQLLLNLSPAVLEAFGYTTAIEGLVNKINETRQIEFTLVVFGMKKRLRKDHELALYRITQELINNVLKHAGARHVSLQIGQRDEKIILMIEDDGVGFNVHEHKDGYGLHNLYARTNLMAGIMTIDSQPGKGTSVLIEIPYK